MSGHSPWALCPSLCSGKIDASALPVTARGGLDRWVRYCQPGGWFEMGDKFVDPSQERDLDDDVSEAQDRAN